jgi:hypothetical protein
MWIALGGLTRVPAQRRLQPFPIRGMVPINNQESVRSMDRLA